MPRRMRWLKKTELGRGVRKFLSRHVYPGDGREAYDFNIKMGPIYVPDSIRARIGDEAVNDVVAQVFEDELDVFANRLLRSGRYPWIEDWYQEGRSGGWFVLVTDEPVLLDEIADAEVARARLIDLQEIQREIDEAKDGLRKYLSTSHPYEGVEA